MTDDTSTPTTEEKKDVTPATPVARGGSASNKGGGNSPRRGRGRRRDDRAAKEFEEAVLQIDRVTRVNKGGRQLRFRISIIIGDKKGRVGFGIAKSAEVVTGIQKAVSKAKKNLIKVPIFADTIPHEVKSIFKSSQVMIMPAAAGKGVVAGGAVRKILELAGVKNALSKVHGSRNKINIARATFEALQSLQNRAPRGAKVEDLEKIESVKTEKVEEKTPKPADKEVKKTAKKVAPKKQAAKE